MVAPSAPISMTPVDSQAIPIDAGGCGSTADVAPSLAPASGRATRQDVMLPTVVGRTHTRRSRAVPIPTRRKCPARSCGAGAACVPVEYGRGSTKRRQRTLLNPGEDQSAVEPPGSANNSPYVMSLF